MYNLEGEKWNIVLNFIGFLDDLLYLLQLLNMFYNGKYILWCSENEEVKCIIVFFF